MLRKSDPLYGYWWFTFYYEALAESLAVLHPEFRPESEDAIDRLLSYDAVV
jgi:hypothetical protein